MEGKDIKDVAEYLNPRCEESPRRVERIRREVGAITLRYQNIEDMIRAFGLPREKLCIHCWVREKG